MEEPFPRPRRVLVVDDIPEIGLVFRDICRRTRGVDVQLTTETDPRRALEILAREPFDLVVSDQRMQHVDGYAVLSEARAREPDGYRILMTGYREIAADPTKVAAASVDAYVQKPLGAHDLMLLLLAFLHGHDEVIAAYRANAREIEALASGRVKLTEATG